MNFKKYCFDNNYYTSKTEQTTHLFMDGGKLHVPSEKYPEFIIKYHDSINKGEKIALVEKLGKNCEMRFFLDIDGYINIDNIIDVSKSILDCDDLSIYECNKKKGIHIVFNKVVNNSEALEYCKSIKEKLNVNEALHIDSSVYNTGLRMIGSVKFKDGKLIDRCYIPLNHENMEYIHNIHINDLKKSIVRIRTIDTIPICKRCEASEVSDASDLDILKKYIKKIDPVYEHIKLLGGKSLNNHYCVYTNSKYCTNIKKEHNSVGIYFVINPKREIYQKCFCPCQKTDNRINGYCCLFKSKKVQLPKYVYNTILPIKE